MLETFFVGFAHRTTSRSVSHAQKGRYRQGWAACLRAPLETAVSVHGYTQRYISSPRRLFSGTKKAGKLPIVTYRLYYLSGGEG